MLEEATVILDVATLTHSSTDSGKAQGQRVSRNEAIRPSAGGREVLEWNWDVYDNESTIVRRNLADDTIIKTWYIRGRVANVRPNPTDPNLALFDWRATSSVDDPFDYVIDLTTGRFLRQTSARGYLNWMPDGRLMRFDGVGQSTFESIDGSTTTPGIQYSIPTGLSPGPYYPSHDGKQIALVLLQDATPIESDLYLADTSTGAMERYTRTKITNYAVWSPDDAMIAFDTDTGYYCNGFGCIGECDSWFAPRSSRNITALGGSDLSATSFGWYRGPSGDNQLVSCRVRGWTAG